MSFRRSENSREWNKWLTAYRQELVATGLPSRIYESEKFWLYFLEHGDLPELDGMLGFMIDQLSIQQAKQLLAFLQVHAQIKYSAAQRDLEIHVGKIAGQR